MRINWETGYYSDAGKRFANMWKLILGEPQWINHEEFLNFDIQDERYPLADFYAAYFEYQYKTVFYDDIQDCLIQDELHMRAYDFAIGALNPYDEFSWQKYLQVIGKLDEFNWINCVQNQRLNEILEKDVARYTDFFTKEDADQQIE